MKKLIVLILLSTLLVLTACKKPPEVTMTGLIFSENNGVYEYSFDGFLLEDIKLTIEYSDNTTKEVPLTRDMLSDYDFDLLLTTGEHYIEITCEGRKLLAEITLTAPTAVNNHLPNLVLYNVVEENEGTYEAIYCTTGDGSFASFQLQYQFNPDEVTNVEVVKAEGLTGSFVSNVEEGLITITYSQPFPSNHKAAVFSIRYQSNEKHGNFTLNEAFNNRFYTADSMVYEIWSMGYFTR
jgi:hypothetical protein